MVPDNIHVRPACAFNRVHVCDTYAHMRITNMYKWLLFMSNCVSRSCHVYLCITQHKSCMCIMMMWIWQHTIHLSEHDNAIVGQHHLNHDGGLHICELSQCYIHDDTLIWLKTMHALFCREHKSIRKFEYARLPWKRDTTAQRRFYRLAQERNLRTHPTRHLSAWCVGTPDQLQCVHSPMIWVRAGK